jgi:ATP-dependent RNA helicase DDX49/DBP8
VSSSCGFKANLVYSNAHFCLSNSGLDIPTVELVLNFDIPRDPTDYIHRVGRTARAGRGGQALSIVSEHDIQLIQNIEAKTSQY